MSKNQFETINMNRSVSVFSASWQAAPLYPILIAFDRMAAVTAIVVIAIITAMPSTNPIDEVSTSGAGAQSQEKARAWSGPDSETVASIYAGAPLYHRSDVLLKRPNGTDMTLERMGWDGDALYFPIDGGARVIRWSGSRGIMVDFLHNKAISRLGKGAHGRKIKNGVVEDVETRGTLKGASAPSPLLLTDLFDRLEFTHGHNTLLLTGLQRLGATSQAMRPYVGIGFGAAIPHVEVHFTGETPDNRTNEYQVAGPALQFLAGLELRSGRGSFYVEYKFIWSSLDVALTGGKSWSLKNLESNRLPRWLIEPFAGLTEMPGDLWRQFTRWRSGAAPGEGTLSTRLTSHTVVVGTGYVWQSPVPVSGEPIDP